MVGDTEHTGTDRLGPAGSLESRALSQPGRRRKRGSACVIMKGLREKEKGRGLRDEELADELRREKDTFKAGGRAQNQGQEKRNCRRRPAAPPRGAEACKRAKSKAVLWKVGEGEAGVFKVLLESERLAWGGEGWGAKIGLLDGRYTQILFVVDCLYKDNGLGSTILFSSPSSLFFFFFKWKG